MFHFHVLVEGTFRAILFLAVLNRTLEMSFNLVGGSSGSFGLYRILVTVKTGLQLFQKLAFFVGSPFGGSLEEVELDDFLDVQNLLSDLLDLWDKLWFTYFLSWRCRKCMEQRW
jgi:hypothetical protein